MYILSVFFFYVCILLYFHICLDFTFMHNSFWLHTLSALLLLSHLISCVFLLKPLKILLIFHSLPLFYHFFPREKMCSSHMVMMIIIDHLGPRLVSAEIWLLLHLSPPFSQCNLSVFMHVLISCPPQQLHLILFPQPLPDHWCLIEDRDSFTQDNMTCLMKMI